MHRRLSQMLLIAEAVLFALPVTALLAVEVVTSATYWGWNSFAIRLVTVLASAAAFSGWRLLVKAVLGGVEALQAAHRGWWFTASIGVLLVVAAVISKRLPESPIYTPAAYFREHLEYCILGSPLVITLGHLWAEATFRKTDSNSLPPTCEDAHG